MINAVSFNVPKTADYYAKDYTYTHIGNSIIDNFNFDNDSESIITKEAEESSNNTSSDDPEQVAQNKASLKNYINKMLSQTKVSNKTNSSKTTSAKTTSSSSVSDDTTSKNKAELQNLIDKLLSQTNIAKKLNAKTTSSSATTNSTDDEEKEKLNATINSFKDLIPASKYNAVTTGENTNPNFLSVDNKLVNKTKFNKTTCF